MSSTSRGAERQPDDFYQTPPWCTRALLRVLDADSLGAPGSILEPTAGTGAIVKVLRDVWPTAEITAIELDEDRANIAGALCGDYLTRHIPGEEPGFELAITNPPFALAQKIIERTLPIATTTALLLRLNYLGSLDRAPFWRAQPADVYILPRRPAFAASIKCGKGKKVRGCGWRVTLPIDAPRPASCPVCQGVISISTTDSCEYAWFVWGPGRGNRWWTLDLSEEAKAAE